MNRRTFTKSLLAVLALGLAAPFGAQAQEDEVFGRQLMTQQEIQEHQRQMRNLQGGEREAYRQEHHERMLERAREHGVDLPDEPRGDGSGRPQGAGPD
ncbi:MAG TPA: hypothetical protein VLN90_08415, partial [Thioalkalivibrio sp.]|nr:hypothetical protein [Thioalkalivibrio sp.]